MQNFTMTEASNLARKTLPKPAGYRFGEWMVLAATSRATITRQIKAGKLKVIDVNGIKLIPHTEAVRLGLAAE